MSEEEEEDGRRVQRPAFGAAAALGLGGGRCTIPRGRRAEGEHVLALESREGTRASRRVARDQQQVPEFAGCLPSR